MIVDDDGVAADPPAPVADVAGRAYGPDDVFLINSTSGTTGMPKCVVHTENRWMYFHQLAVDAGDMTTDDVFLSAIPAPFGFGIWTAHVTPAVLGAPTVVHERFDADEVIRTIERERVTVLACVSTQFLMMLKSPIVEQHDLSSLRCMFTGGEAVPEARAARFEDVTGARVLQFYGSNETGVLSGTTMRDDRDHRLQTAGRLIADMHVRLLDDDGRDITTPDTPGHPVCKGPATCLGYLDDARANAELFTADGWMRIGDLCTVDADGYLRVVGRTSDIIIRGGKNISAPAVEAEVAHHPDVALAAAVAMPDEVFGERVCVYVELEPGTALELDALVGFLRRPRDLARVVPRAPRRRRDPPPRLGRQGRQGRAARRHPAPPRAASMTNVTFAPLPQAAAWRHVGAQDGFESVFLRDVASGHVVDEHWVTQHCRVGCWSEHGERETQLSRDAAGRWRVDGLRARTESRGGATRPVVLPVVERRRRPAVRVQGAPLRHGVRAPLRPRRPRARLPRHRHAGPVTQR